MYSRNGRETRNRTVLYLVQVRTLLYRLKLDKQYKLSLKSTYYNFVKLEVGTKQTINFETQRIQLAKITNVSINLKIEYIGKQ